VLNPKRRTALRARMRDPTWRDGWREALDRIPKCSFLMGHGSRRWKADLEWFLRPDSVSRILEGKYDDNDDGTYTGERDLGFG
jgi:hypothetical protein